MSDQVAEQSTEQSTDLRTLPNGLSVHGLNRSETEYLYKEIFEDQSYVPPEGFRFPEQPVVVDVGANIGMFALFMATNFPDARVFSFEPVPRTFDALHKNVGGLANVSVFNMALGDAPQTRELTFYPQYSMMSGFDADPEVDRALVKSYIGNIAETLDQERRELVLEEADELIEGRFEAVERVSCRIDRLETVAAELGIDRIDFLKIDVEGFEVKVLKGIGDSLWPRIAQAAVEVEDDNGELAEVTELFAARGMTTVVEQPEEYRGTSVYNVFASREEGVSP
ncbi:FkbM family methyltransferase [Streptomyces lincolnensis]|uniref:FkbM family methyltransferase n=1 Tax=Streptomyces lincolnensis TaxID=1915 RepID=UPI001E4F360C|nr:FkbM family methyltransferase [Streptomyces lincolnensis]MCD7444483.1 FkbM family methyltransferase [Streptomyces lincolnensis]